MFHEHATSIAAACCDRREVAGMANFKFLKEFFEIFKKASRGPSAADLDHYGRGQTRSE